MLDYDRNSSRGINAAALGASLGAQTVKNLPAMQEARFSPWVGKIPWSRERQPTPVTPAWRTSWTEVPGGLQSVESQSRTQRRAEAQRPAVESLASAETAQELGQLWPTD